MHRIRSPARARFSFLCVSDYEYVWLYVLNVGTRDDTDKRLVLCVWVLVLR